MGDSVEIFSATQLSWIPAAIVNVDRNNFATVTYTRDGKPASPKLRKHVNLTDASAIRRIQKRESKNPKSRKTESKKPKDGAESSPFQQEVEKLQGRLGSVDARLRAGPASRYVHDPDTVRL